MMNVGPLGAMNRIFDENTEGVSGVKGGTARKGLKDSSMSVNINSNGSHPLFTHLITRSLTTRTRSLTY